MTGTTESITRDELAEALQGLPLFIGDDERVKLSAVRPAELAEMLLARACTNREPEHEPGAVYQDADGGVWVYQPQGHDGGLCCWLSPGTQGVWSSVSPRRPLRKLVPLPTREEVTAMLTLDGAEQWDDIMLSTYRDRVMRLLEGDK